LFFWISSKIDFNLLMETPIFLFQARSSQQDSTMGKEHRPTQSQGINITPNSFP